MAAAASDTWSYALSKVYARLPSSPAYSVFSAKNGLTKLDTPDNTCPATLAPLTVFIALSAAFYEVYSMSASESSLPESFASF